MTIQKFDPVYQRRPRDHEPVQHGEVFVTDDGAETDLDLGHYERFIDVDLTQHSNVPPAKSIWSIINKERRGDFLGATVQVIPHVTNEIKAGFRRPGADPGTWSSPRSEVRWATSRACPSWRRSASSKRPGPGPRLYIHVTLVPYIVAPRRAEDQADPAQRQGAAQPRHPARHHRLPVRASPSEE